MAKLRKSGEDYLEAVLVLKKEKGVVRSIDVAHHMDYSKPSVSRAVSNLRRDGYLEMADGGELTLTESGLQAAEGIYQRHIIISSLLISLGVPPDVAADDACGVEHVISKQTFDCLRKVYNKGLQEGSSSKKSDDKKKKRKKNK